jgi:hypothetical protein
VRLHGATQALPCDRLFKMPPSIARTGGVEALVRYEKSDYSVPARWVGTRVIVIRAKDLIVAEHLVTTGPPANALRPPRP